MYWNVLGRQDMSFVAMNRRVKKYIVCELRFKTVNKIDLKVQLYG